MTNDGRVKTWSDVLREEQGLTALQVSIPPKVKSPDQIEGTESEDSVELLRHIKTTASLDVAYARDFSVLSIIEVYDVLRENPFGSPTERFSTVNREYHLVFQEMKRGLDYPGQVEWILHKLNTYAALPRKRDVPLTLVTEINGVGITLYQSIKKMLPQSWYRKGILLTNGEFIEEVDSVYHLNKKECINSLLYVLDKGQLKIPEDLPTKQDLLTQASGFIRSYTETGREKLGSETESVHDDIIMSLSEGIWYSLYRQEAGATWSPYGTVMQAKSAGLRSSRDPAFSHLRPVRRDMLR